MKVARGLRRVPRRPRRKGQPGARPGQLVIDPEAHQSRLSVIAYGPDDLLERPDCRASELPAILEAHRVTWVNVEGLGDADLLKQVAELFEIHHLALEDAVNLSQRPKLEAYGDQLFLVTQVLQRKERLQREQISLCMGERFVVTFQERPGDPFQPVRERLRNSWGRLRQSGADYLAYALLDAAIDQFFPVIDALQDHLEDLEAALRHPDRQAIEKIQAARAELLEARSAVSPLRDVTRGLLSVEWKLLSDSTRVYLRDCRDHVLEAIEQLESCREIASGLMDVHLSTVSHQANRTMNVLTIIATIFMPLSFLAGIYGMNFDPSISKWNMPELSHPYGYPILLGLMAAIGVGLGILFWRKGWFE